MLLNQKIAILKRKEKRDKSHDYWRVLVSIKLMNQSCKNTARPHSPTSKSSISCHWGWMHVSNTAAKPSTESAIAATLQHSHPRQQLPVLCRTDHPISTTSSWRFFRSKAGASAALIWGHGNRFANTAKEWRRSIIWSRRACEKSAVGIWVSPHSFRFWCLYYNLPGVSAFANSHEFQYL